MRGKGQKKEREKEEKKRRKGGKKMEIKLQKKNKKKQKKTKRNETKNKKSGIFFLCVVVIFGAIRSSLFRIKHTISTFVFMQDFFDEQFMGLLRAKHPPHPLFCNTSKNLWQSKDYTKSADSATNWIYFNGISYQTMFKCTKRWFD